MKRYQQDPNAPSHLRKLLDSAKADDLDAERRNRVAARLGVGTALTPTPGLAARPPAPSRAPAPPALAPRPRLSLVTIAVGAVVLMGAATAVIAESRPRAPIEARVAPAALDPAATIATPVVEAPAIATATPTPAITAEPRVAEAVPSVSIAALPDVKRRAHAIVAPAIVAPVNPSPRETTTPPLPATSEAQADVEPGDLHAELVALQGVRSAIGAGQPRDALTRLDAYDARFRTGKLREEASVLRIEALAAAGEHRAAQSAADRLLGESPNTVYAARVRAAVARASRE
jgi:hypothetical protein